MQQMWTKSLVIIYLILNLYIAYKDYKYKEIDIKILLCSIFVAILNYRGEFVFFPGIISFLIAFLSKEKIGYADVLIIVSYSIFIGKRIYIVIFLSLIILYIYVLLKVLLKKIKLNERISYIPIIYVSLIVCLVIKEV